MLLQPGLLRHKIGSVPLPTSVLWYTLFCFRVFIAIRRFAAGIHARFAAGIHACFAACMQGPLGHDLLPMLSTNHCKQTVCLRFQHLGPTVAGCLAGFRHLHKHPRLQQHSIRPPRGRLHPTGTGCWRAPSKADVPHPNGWAIHVRRDCTHSTEHPCQLVVSVAAFASRRVEDPENLYHQYWEAFQPPEWRSHTDDFRLCPSTCNSLHSIIYHYIPLLPITIIITCQGSSVLQRVQSSCPY